MKRILIILAVLSFGDKAWAISYCSTYGNHTYCDDGSSYHRYGKTITELDSSGKSRNRYRSFGNSTYGNGREWVTRHKDDSFTSSGLRGKTRQVLPDILDREDDEDSESSDE